MKTIFHFYALQFASINVPMFPLSPHYFYIRLLDEPIVVVGSSPGVTAGRAISDTWWVLVAEVVDGKVK